MHPQEILDQALAAAELPVASAPGGERVVRVPSHLRGPIAVLLDAGERTTHLRAFVMRAPDRGHEEVYRRLLRRMMGDLPWRFALDDFGDVHALCTFPTEAVSGELLDGLLGALAILVDEMFEGLVAAGFAPIRPAAAT